ncbi:MAG: TPM domain-containing protein [Luteolibacter sp.]
MQCPYCQTLQQAAASECPACRITFPRTSALVGALPRLAPVVADTTRSLSAAEQGKLKARIEKMQRRFPQLVLQVVMHQFPNEHPFSMHVFWLFNAGNFAGDGRRGKDNHALLIALDPTRGESAIILGYGLETFIKTEALDHLLELASPAWEHQRWADGLSNILDGLDQLIESVAVPAEAAPGARDTEF